MKNKVIFTLFLFIFAPIHIFALEENITISCNQSLLKNNMETECKIEAKNLNFMTTSITGQVKVSENLSIMNSSYDKDKWKILDKTFSVEDINLISENKSTESSFTIATFKLKAKNTNDSTGEVMFVNVELGDENYESHNVNVNNFLIELKYDVKNEDVKDNPNTNDLNIITLIIIIILPIGYYIFNITKRKINR